MQYNISISQDLRRNASKGKYFAFEGIDGCGKSTQVERVREKLENMGKKVVVTTEPMTQGAIQEVIRDALFAKVTIPSRAYQAIYSADRAVNHAEIVEPALERGDVVLTHRSFWSALSYGVLDLGEEYDVSKIGSILISQGIFSKFHQFVAPDKTFYLQVSSKHAAGRLSQMDKEKDIYESEAKLAKIVTGYERVVKEFKDEFIVINGEQNEEKITEEILQKIASL